MFSKPRQPLIKQQGFHHGRGNPVLATQIFNDLGIGQWRLSDAQSYLLVNAERQADALALPIGNDTHLTNN